MPTVREILKKTTDWFAERGLDTPGLDAQLLLGRALGVDRLKLFMEPNRVLTEEELAASREMVKRRGVGRESVAHIIGRKEFLGFDFAVTADTLIPRPETELLVETAVEFLRGRFGPGGRARRETMYDVIERIVEEKKAEAAKAAASGEAAPGVEEGAAAAVEVAVAEEPEPYAAQPLAFEEGEEAAPAPRAGETPLFCDIGTGSGVVAICVALLFPEARGWAVDCSEPALEVARQNAQALGAADNLALEIGSFYALNDGAQPMPERGLDLIVSNPPYIAEGDAETLSPEVSNEPALALFGGEDGLEAIRALIGGAPERLKPGGMIALEIGAGQAEEVQALLAGSGLWETIGTKRDLAGIERVVHANLRA